MMMYVVKKPFKSMGKFYGVGSIIEDPTTIKRFKSKVNEGKIVVVTEDNLQSVAAYIKARSGVDILPGFTKAETTDNRLSSKPKPNKSKPNKSKPNKSKPNKSKPNKSKPNKSKPNKSKPNKSKPVVKAKAKVVIKK